MQPMLVAITLETLDKVRKCIEIDLASTPPMLTAISKVTHGDLDVSCYVGYEPIYAGYGEKQPNSVLQPRFVALLRRIEDGALRLIRHWAHDDFMEGDMLVAEDFRWKIEEAFSTHDISTRIFASSICHAYEKVDATEADVMAHDASILRELAWHVRKAASRVMTPSVRESLEDSARTVTPPRQEAFVSPLPGNFWFTDHRIDAWYQGHVPTIGRFHAVNHNHLRATAARLEEAGDSEAASTLRWMGWHRDIDENRHAFLKTEAARIQEDRVVGLETAIRSILGIEVEIHHYVDSTMRQNPTECLSRHQVAQIGERALEESRQMGSNYEAFSGRRPHMKDEA